MKLYRLLPVTYQVPGIIHRSSKCYYNTKPRGICIPVYQHSGRYWYAARADRRGSNGFPTPPPPFAFGRHASGLRGAPTVTLFCLLYVPPDRGPFFGYLDPSVPLAPLLYCVDSTVKLEIAVGILPGGLWWIETR